MKNEKVKKNWEVKSIRDIQAIITRELPDTENKLMDIFGKVQKKNPTFVLKYAREIADVISQYLQEISKMRKEEKAEREHSYVSIGFEIDRVMFGGKLQEILGDDEVEEKVKKRIMNALKPVSILKYKIDKGLLLTEE